MHVNGRKLFRNPAPKVGPVRYGTLITMPPCDEQSRALRYFSALARQFCWLVATGWRPKRNGPRNSSEPVRHIVLAGKFGAGEGIRTLDPNLGKRKIAVSDQCAQIQRCMRRCVRVRALSASMTKGTLNYSVPRRPRVNGYEICDA